jgi:hypothetical protein
VWKGKLLSIGGRVTLLNVVISSIPLYWMSIYRLSIKVKNEIDKIRNRFLWYDEHSVKKRYHFISWKIVCASKKNRGLELLDLEIMNKALLAKWLIKFNDNIIVKNK